MTSALRALVLALPLLAAASAMAEDEAPPLPFELTTPEAAPVAPEASASASAPSAMGTGDEAIRLLSQALDRIAALQLLLAAPQDAFQRDQAMMELEETRRSLQSALIEVGRLQQDEDIRVWLRSEGLTVPPAEADALAEPLVEAPTTLDPDLFRGLVNEIEGVSFTEGKMGVLTRELQEETVTSDQASRLVELFSFSRDRVDALVFLHPRITDPENFESLLSALKFESDRETVRNQLGLDG